MTYTTNYNLKKPDEDDFYSINDANINMDIIDAKIKEIESTEVYKTSLITGNWGTVAPYAVQMSVPGIREEKKYFCEPIWSDDKETFELQEAAWNCISRIKVLDDKIQVICYKKKPVVNLGIELRRQK